MERDLTYFQEIRDRINRAKKYGLSESAKLIIFGELSFAVQEGVITINEAKNLEGLMDFDRSIYEKDIEISGFGDYQE